MTKILSIPALAVILSIAGATPVLAHEEPPGNEAAACARYLGNAGVLIERGGAKIIFDAFYADSYGQYALVPDAIANALLKGAPPYDGIDAVFVSHAHGDHFTPAPTLAFMAAHPDVALFASRQTVDGLIKAGASPHIKKRLTAFDLSFGDAPETVSFKDVVIEVAAIPHAGGPSRADIQNLAFRVTLNDDTTVLHLGDAGPEDAQFAHYQDHWDARRLDIAFPPYWLLDSAAGRSILDERLRASYNIGVHVPAAGAGHGDDLRTQAGGDLFTDPGETRILGSAAGDYCQ